MKKYTFPLLLLILIYSCKKDNIQAGGETATLEFSQDTIIFDTVFTSIGSTTKQLMVYNNNDFDITTNVQITGESGSHFRMNVDGEPGNVINDVLIRSNDSIFIFVEVTIDPTQDTDPLIVTNSIDFTTGKKVQKIDLVACAEDAYFYVPNTIEIVNDQKFYYHKIDENTDWNSDKPHVIYGYVGIAPGNTLTINEGTTVYIHKNSGIFVGSLERHEPPVGGTIKVNGEFGNKVTFRGDRRDSWYDSIPGQWDQILLCKASIDNEFNYVNFRNGTIAIRADSNVHAYSNPKAKINNCKIDNMSGIGILGQGASLEVNNSIITKCGLYAVACNFGGDYTFRHCTFANYWNFDNRNTPSILLNNWYEDVDGEIQIRDLNNAYFGNCIIDGNLTTEISFQENTSGNFNYVFDHCLIKIDPNENTNTSNYINIEKNQDPGFVSKDLFDFHLKESSICNDAGDYSINQNIPVLDFDIEGNTRGNPPDLGALER